jgi:hypothetical protein
METSVTSAGVSAASAATSASSAATSAASSLTSANIAISSAATAVSSAATAVSSAATAISSAATAVTSAAQAATSATSAATSATYAATSASSAATSATSSANSAGVATTSASIALTSAATAVSSAAQAATSASSAATSAANAAISASSAATSASSAATTYTAYDVRYLGSKPSAPTVDNYGNNLITGATYWNSTGSTMYAWSGSSWQAISTTGGLSLAGGTMTGPLNLYADPTNPTEAATKAYVDQVTTAINFHAPVTAASTANLATTYSNGTSGVGATLTADTNRAFNTLDGASVVVGNRVLIKNQTDQKQNGIYTLTTNGSGSVPWVLTRATDNDNNPTGEMANGDIVFVQAGTLNIGKTYVNATPIGAITIGTTNIIWSEFTASLPPQSGNAGKFLTTDGTSPSWVTVDAAPQIMMLMGA